MTKQHLSHVHLKPRPQPRISIYFALTFHNAPEEYRGLTNESWNFGKDEDMTLGVMVGLVAKKIIDFYLTTMRHITAEDAQKQIKTISRLIGTLRVEKRDDPNTVTLNKQNEP